MTGKDMQDPRRGNGAEMTILYVTSTGVLAAALVLLKWIEVVRFLARFIPSDF